MHQSMRIVLAIRGYLFLFLCFSLNGIGFMIGWWLYYKETVRKQKCNASTDTIIGAMNTFAGNQAAYPELR